MPRNDVHVNLSTTSLRFLSLIYFGAAALCSAQQATVNVDELQIHSNSSSKSAVTGLLKRGDHVTIGLVLSGSDQSWCEVKFPGPPPLSGFVPCGGLQREANHEEPASTASSPPNTAAARVNADAAIAEALSLSGISQAIQQLGDPSLYLSSMPQSQLNPQQAAAVRQLAMQSVHPEKFQQAVMASIKSAYPPDAYPQLLDILRSPLSRQMTAIELAEPRIDPKKLQAFAASLKDNPPTAQHWEIINRIDKATGNSQSRVDVVSAVIEGIAAGSGQLSSPKAQSVLEQLRGERGDALRQAALIQQLYLYRSVPDDQLNTYATMLSSPAMVRFNQVAQGGMIEAVRQTAAEMMALMIQRLGVKPPPAK